MKTAILLLLLTLAVPTAKVDGLRFTRITGGPPLSGVSDARTDLGVIQGKDFEKIRAQVQKIINQLVKHGGWMPDKALWWDVGPDAGYVSAVVRMDGKTYTINSWYPLHRQSSNTAVSETGLVDVKSMSEKQKVEAKNSEAYKQIVSIFDFIPKQQQK
jgi:hypothetical protein